MWQKMLQVGGGVAPKDTGFFELELNVVAESQFVGTKASIYQLDDNDNESAYPIEKKIDSANPIWSMNTLGKFVAKYSDGAKEYTKRYTIKDFDASGIPICDPSIIKLNAFEGKIIPSDDYLDWELYPNSNNTFNVSSTEIYYFVPANGNANQPVFTKYPVNIGDFTELSANLKEWFGGAVQYANIHVGLFDSKNKLGGETLLDLACQSRLGTFSISIPSNLQNKDLYVGVSCPNSSTIVGGTFDSIELKK